MSNDDASGFEITWGRALIPVSLLVLVVLRFGFGAPLWVLAALSLWVPVYYILYPWFLKRQWDSFEQEFTVKFQQGAHRELLDDYQNRWFLRKFGPHAAMLEKLGLIYAAMEKYREAEHVFEQALDASDDRRSDKLLFNLANVKYELGKYADAEEIYRSLQGDHSPYSHAIRTQLALIDLHKGRRVEEAREFLEDERERATGLMRHRIERALG
jgi:tetratricopeptide (TPR) repeat protein